MIKGIVKSGQPRPDPTPEEVAEQCATLADAWAEEARKVGDDAAARAADAIAQRIRARGWDRQHRPPVRAAKWADFNYRGSGGLYE